MKYDRLLTIQQTIQHLSEEAAKLIEEIKAEEKKQETCPTLADHDWQQKSPILLVCSKCGDECIDATKHSYCKHIWVGSQH